MKLNEGLGTDQVFLTLYRELYFRHVYAKLEPNVDDRFQSYENICELFNLLLSMYRPLAYLSSVNQPAQTNLEG